MSIVKNVEKINNGILDITEAINGCTVINNVLTNIKDNLPRFSSDIKSTINSMNLKISGVFNQLKSYGSDVQNAIKILDAMDETTEQSITPKKEISDGVSLSKSGVITFDFFDDKINIGTVESEVEKWSMDEKLLEEYLVSQGLDRSDAKRIAQNRGKTYWYEEIGNAAVDITNSGAKYATNVAGLFTGDATITDVIESGIKFQNKIGATEAVIVSNVVRGALYVVEGVVDGAITIGGGAVALGTSGFDYFAGTNSSNVVQEWVMNTTAYNTVDNVYNATYNTEYGKYINENSALKYDSTCAKSIANGTEFASMIGITLIPGAGPAIASGIAGLKATGQKAEEEFSKEERDFWSGTGKAVLSGGWEAAQWYVGAKIGGTLNATNASQVSGKPWQSLYNTTSNFSNGGKMVLSATSEATVGVSDTIVRSGIDTIGSEKTWNEIFTENYGGIKGMTTNAFIAAGIDIGFDVGGDLLTIFKNSRADITSNDISDGKTIESIVLKNASNQNINSKNISGNITSKIMVPFETLKQTGAKISYHHYSVIDNLISKQYNIQTSDKNVRESIIDDIIYNRRHGVSKSDIKTFYSTTDQNILMQHYENKYWLKTKLNKNIPILEGISDIDDIFNNGYPTLENPLEEVNNFLKSNFIFPTRYTDFKDNVILSTNAFNKLIVIDSYTMAFLVPIGRDVKNVFKINNLDRSTIIHENIHYTGSNNSSIGLHFQEKYLGINEGITEFITSCVEEYIDGKSVPIPQSGYTPITEIYSTMNTIMNQYNSINKILSPKGVRALTECHYDHNVNRLEYLFKQIGGTDTMWNDFINNSYIVANPSDLYAYYNAKNKLFQINNELMVNASNKLTTILPSFQY